MEERLGVHLPFFFTDAAPTEIYTLSLHDALPILRRMASAIRRAWPRPRSASGSHGIRSEEHTSELQSRGHLVCRLLLEKKKQTNTKTLHNPDIHDDHHAAPSRHGDTTIRDDPLSQ